MGIRRKVNISIGDCVRLDNWTDCYIDVMDVGKYSFWGVLIDQKKDAVIDPMFLAPKEPAQGSWNKVLTLEEIIS